jgi:20S proteasome alpha/beta subunit
VNIKIFGNIYSPENTDVNVIYLFKANQRNTTIAVMVEEIIIVYKIKQAKQFSLNRTFDELLSPIQQPFRIHLHPH